MFTGKNRIRRFLQYFASFKRFAFITIVIAVALFSFLFHSCSRYAQTPETIILRMAVPSDEQDSWIPLIEQFQAQHENVEIDLQVGIGSDALKRQYIDSFQPENPDNSTLYDLVYIDTIWLPEFVENGWLKDLSTDFPNQAALVEEGFLQDEVDSGFYNGKLYRIPFRTDAGVLYYRRDLLEQINQDPPETFTELIESVKLLQAQGIVNEDDGYLWQGSDDEAIAAMFLEVLHGHGGFWINTERIEDDLEEAVGLDREEAIAALDFLRQTLQENISPDAVLTYSEENTRETFRDGNVVFMRNWPAAWAAVSGSDFNLGIKSMVSNASGEPAATKGGWGFGIAHNASHPEAAIDAIKFFSSAAAQRRFTLEHGSVPSRRALFFDPEIVSKYNHYPRLFDIIDQHLVSRPRIPEYGSVSCILQQYLHEALDPDNLNQTNSRDVMNRAASDTRDFFRSGESNC